ncbi:MAG TPA: hypothetical protein VKX96_09305 [Chloroflexota bacterium]|nr:hypothetical protein [Chloroflexota bacterium]
MEKRRRKGKLADDRNDRASSNRRTLRRLYEDLFSADERAALADAVASSDLEQEVALLRVLIRRGVAEGVDLETLSRSLGRLVQMLRVQRVIQGQAAKSLDEALGRVLEEIGNEMGI